MPDRSTTMHHTITTYAHNVDTMAIESFAHIGFAAAHEIIYAPPAGTRLDRRSHQAERYPGQELRRSILDARQEGK